MSVKPGITGTAQQGDTLSVSDGTWSNNPTAFSYVWQDCDSSGTTCLPISGATSSSYTLRASDVGSKVLAVVTASNAGGQNSVTSAVVGPVLPAAPVDSIAPGISGTAQQGNTLTVSDGVWSNNPTAFTYAWQDCNSSGTTCSAISRCDFKHLRASSVGRWRERERHGHRVQLGRPLLGDHDERGTGVAAGAREHTGSGAQRDRASRGTR